MKGRKAVKPTKLKLIGGPWNGQTLLRRDHHGMTITITVVMTGRYDMTTGEWHAKES